ncbi:branched chain amino acid aminotransferase /branched chain amino acid: 2-keto-4-methylthiobutyrate aminotransferase [Scopulibacillus darangshiensis]|uniref:Branched-chain-amino-acid aminotransferase n=1 Tax=Scopulibacillus darangshiensis TaxID=442528 RepID=A0A4R2P8S2_9BACL|nr:branched-chain amino acid aminotransferase [Scopulibacillus darangshiensis]TCP31267.1 branched chain amino acid aminotransferase /branched chain amino acid: 2-keto-4-methylthiobutyrate aminotransferase [Scopulibacillus darangshiensis]
MNQMIERVKTSSQKEKPSVDALGFGKYFSDYMFTMDYETEKGWHSPKITPYEPLVLDPSAMVFHYGQAVFEGLKAYRTDDGKALLFRPLKNIKRLNLSCERMSIPTLDEDLVMDAIHQLVELEKDWIPNGEGTSLYIRPFIIATEPYLGVRPSHSYKFMVILSPVGAYYSGQLNPVKIYVEDYYVRAVPGGVGHVKTSGNYAASLKAQNNAEELGFEQVLWLDAKEKKYIEEVGSMNIFFKINGEVITPKLNGSILSGITRDSVIELLKHWDVPVREERISLEDIFKAHANGDLEEVFGSGTAAVISPVGELKWGNESITVNDNKIGQLSFQIYDTITKIQLGRADDPFNWTFEV